jgi:hypothetical protein
MEEPSLHGSRIALAGALGAALVVGGAGFLLGRATTERTPAVIAQPVAAPAPKPAPEPAVPKGVLGRADLIALAAKAADAAADGREPVPQVAAADGRRFELRLPFGCSGPSGEDSSAALRWRHDPEDQALRIHAAPVTWTAQDWWGPDAAAGVEAVEGFWIARPWTSSEACPAGDDRSAAAGAEPVTLPGQTLAVGQIFFTEGARGGRRDGRPYETVVRIPEDELDVSAGFRLRISGRIARTRNAGPVLCRQPGGPEQRPICLVSVVIDEVAIENPATGKTLATWTVAGRETPEG